MKPISEEEKGYREPYDVTEDDVGGYFEGERVQIEEVMDRVIVISAIDVRPSDFSDGDYAIVQMIWDDDLQQEQQEAQTPYTFTTSSGVLLKQLKQLKDRMPIRAKITARLSEATGREYYTLSPPVALIKKGARGKGKGEKRREEPLTFDDSEKEVM